jgi:isoquinoline 1-oxidoreductase beta subunit
VDPDGVDSAQDIPYDIENLRVEFNREEPPGVITGFWRGVGPNNNVFAIESFIDELAHKAGQDPIAFRRAHLSKTPRLQAALDLVREKSGWGAPLPSRCGRGVAAQTAFASFIATVVECQVDDHGEVKLRRVTSAVDTGIAVNPDTIVAQLQGGLIFGLTAGLYGDITLEKGRVQQSNFHDYRILRMDQVPPIEVHLIRNGEAPGGIGEPGTSIAGPALANALFAATGVRLRSLPVDRKQLAPRKAA